MGRGRKRKFNPNIPKHIDQAALPKGIYFSDGRWFRFEPCPEGGPDRKKTIANQSALLSELHAIVEAANGEGERGTVAYVLNKYLKSGKFKKLAEGTKDGYRRADLQVKEFKTLQRVTLGQLHVDKLSVPVFQRMVDYVAEEHPTKANHMLRYVRRAFSYGVQRGHCKTNPAKGVSLAEEAGEFNMPEPAVYERALKFARTQGQVKAHTKGSMPPYLAPAMEIAYGCRLRGIEVNTLTDAHALKTGILSNRRKGSRDNITRWNDRLRAAWGELVAIRKAAWTRKSRPIPVRPEHRFLMVNQSGTPLKKSSLDTAWQRFMAAAIKANVITEDQRFGLHGLKHRGITDSVDKSAGGHVTQSMKDRYDHSVPVVEPPAEPQADHELEDWNQGGEAAQ